MDELLTDAYEEISRLAKQKDEMAGVPTGFKDVDDLFHGFRGGDLVILAARPGVGKTSFALNLATNAAKAGPPSPSSRWRSAPRSWCSVSCAPRPA